MNKTNEATIKSNPFFSVFIGLYNSENVIQRFFDSVKNQVFRDFELIIIDDCSKDNTIHLVDDFIKKIEDIDVVFIKHKINKGINGSRTEAVELAKGKVFVKWDHDDYQDPNQLLDYHTDFNNFIKGDVAALWYLSKDMQGNIVGNKFPKENMVGTYFSMYTKYILHTPKKPRERHNCIGLDTQKKIHEYLYSNKIIPEDVYPDAVDIWAALAMMGYKTVHINRAYRYYFMETDRPRISNEGRSVKADRIFLDRITWINIYMKYLPKTDIMCKLRMYMSAIQYGLLSGKNLKNILTNIQNPIDKFLIILIYIPVFVILKSLARI